MSNEAIFDIIKNKDYIVRPFLFKIIVNNNLSVNETLLLIILSNQERPMLDINLINDLTGLSNAGILEAFSSLTDKGLIKTDVKKEGDKVIETISLESIYKLAASDINNKAKVKTEKTIYDLFESEFNRKLTPMEYEFISEWINSGMNEELIKEALKEATYNGVANLRYIDKIIYEWTKKGYKTVDDVKSNRYKKEDKSSNIEIFDYNWLDEN